jgi:hypothetical protein
MPITEMLIKGKYFVAGVNLYYVLDTRPIEGLLLVENCYTCKVEWIPANEARHKAREVIKATCEIMPVS